MRYFFGNGYKIISLVYNNVYLVEDNVITYGVLFIYNVLLNTYNVAKQ